MENKNRQASINSHLTPQTDSGQLNWSTATTTNADMILSSDIIIIVRWWSCLFRDFPALYGCVCVGGVLRNDMTDRKRASECYVALNQLSFGAMNKKLLDTRTQHGSNHYARTGMLAKHDAHFFLSSLLVIERHLPAAQLARLLQFWLLTFVYKSRITTKSFVCVHICLQIYLDCRLQSWYQALSSVQLNVRTITQRATCIYFVAVALTRCSQVFVVALMTERGVT